jgi:WD40 repeat protein
MQRLLCSALAFLLFVVSNVQAEDAPLFIEIKGNGGVRFSPDGKRLAIHELNINFVNATIEPGPVGIWDTETGKKLHTLELQGNVATTAFLPDGKKLVTTDSKNNVQFWDTESGKELQKWKLQEDEKFITAYSPGGAKIAASNKNDLTVRIYDAESGRELQTLDGHIMPVFSATFSSDSKKIITTGLDATARIWGAESGKELQTLIGHVGVVWSGTFLPDETKIVTVGEDKTVRIWDVASGKELQKLGEFAEMTFFAPFSPPNGRRMATGGTTFETQIWDTESGKELRTLQGRVVHYSPFSPNGMRIVLLGKPERPDDPRKPGFVRYVLVYDVESGLEIDRLEYNTTGRLLSAMYSPDGKKIIVTSSDNTTRIWDLERMSRANSRPAIQDF